MLLNTINFSVSLYSYSLIIVTQTLLLWSVVKIFYTRNYYQVTLLGFLIVFWLSIYLYWLQLDVFGSFLLVAESVIFLFIFSMLVFLNIKNFTHLTSLNFHTLPLVIILLFNVSFVKPDYLSPLFLENCFNIFNDLSSQFIYFYIFDIPVLGLIGSWLLIVTLVLVSAIWFIFSNQISSTKKEFLAVISVRRVADLGKQFSTKPTTIFFK